MTPERGADTLENTPWWGGPPGPRPTPPSSACWHRAGLRCNGGSGGTRADQGVRPTRAIPTPAFIPIFARRGGPGTLVSVASGLPVCGPVPGVSTQFRSARHLPGGVFERWRSPWRILSPHRGGAYETA